MGRPPRAGLPPSPPAAFARPVLALVAVAALASGARAAPPAPAGRALAVLPAAPAVARGGAVQLRVSPEADVAWSVEPGPVAPPRAGPDAFPLAVSADGRHVVDRHGAPWRIQADAAWLMSTNATPAEVETYLETRAAQGFNAFYLMAMVHPGGYGPAPHAPNDRAGDPPFATPGVFATAAASPASERYWRWIDWIVDRAAAHGMAVMLAYTYLGFLGGPEGWYRVLLEQGSREACEAWGEWLGRRYRDRANVVWLALGDYTPPAGSEGEARTLAVIRGIKRAGARQLFMAEVSGGASVPSLDAPAFASSLDLNSFYGYGPSGHGECYVEADRAWRVSPPRPAWVQEGGYEYEDNTGGFAAQPWETRRTRFWGVLAGGTAGDGFGSLPAWKWGGLPGSLRSPGAEYAAHAFRLFSALPWWDLRPSGTGPGQAGRELVVSGRGTWGRRDWVTAAVTGSGSHLLAYVPPRPSGGRRFSWEWIRTLLSFSGPGPRTIAIDAGALAGPARARWFDPATGSLADADGGSAFANAGTREFRTPGRRADGTDDWLLVVETVDATRCGTVTAAGRYAPPVAASPGTRCRVVARLRAEPAVAAGVTVEVR